MADVGHLIKRRNEETEKLLRQQQVSRENARRLKNELREAKEQYIMRNFWSKFDVRTANAMLTKVVELGLGQADNELKKKQNKLKSLLLEEQSKYSMESVDKAQYAWEQFEEMRKNKAREIQKKKDDSDKSFVDRMYTQIAIRDSHDYKEDIRRNLNKIIHEDNAIMMRARNCEKLALEEEEKVWTSKLDYEEDKRLKVKDEEIPIIQALERNYYECLKKQIDENKRIRKNEAYIEEVQDRSRKEIDDQVEYDQETRQEEAKRREILGAKALTEQIEEKRLLNHLKQQDELFLENVMQGDVRRKDEWEKRTKKDNWEQARRELVIFRDSMVQYRKSIVALDEDFDQMLYRTEKDENLKRSQKFRGLEREKQNLSVQYADALKLMVAEREAKEAEINERNLKLDALVAQNRERNKRLDDAYRIHQSEKSPVPHNQESVKYLGVLAERRRLEDQELAEELRKTCEEQRRRVDMMLRRPQMAGTAVHPLAQFYHSRTPERE